jgi:hypothetical protein
LFSRSILSLISRLGRPTTGSHHPHEVAYPLRSGLKVGAEPESRFAFGFAGVVMEGTKFWFFFPSIPTRGCRRNRRNWFCRFRRYLAVGMWGILGFLNEGFEILHAAASFLSHRRGLIR